MPAKNGSRILKQIADRLRNNGKKKTPSLIGEQLELFNGQTRQKIRSDPERVGDARREQHFDTMSHTTGELARQARLDKLRKQDELISRLKSEGYKTPRAILTKVLDLANDSRRAETNAERIPDNTESIIHSQQNTAFLEELARNLKKQVPE
jgi:hypothetical protein